MVTKLEFLVAKEKMLVALATLSVAILSPASAKISREFKNGGISTPAKLIHLGCLENHIVLFQIPTSMFESMFIVIALPSLVYPHF